MNYQPIKLNSNIDFNRSFDDFDSRLPNDLIQIERNGYIFQMSKNPFSGIRYKGKKKQVIGYRYSLGMHLIAGHGNADGLEKIKVGEKVAWTQSNVLKDSQTSIVTAFSLASDGGYGQTFTTTSSYTLNSMGFMVWRNWNAFPGTIYVEVRAADAGGMPTGDILCSGTFDGDAIVEQPASLSLADWIEVEFDTPPILVNNTKYAVTFDVNPYSSAGFGGCNFNATSGGGVYTGGELIASLDDGDTWAAEITDADLVFKAYKKDGSAPNSTITISNNNLFGGDRKEGGISGDVDLMFGATDQVQNSYLKARINAIDAGEGDDIPAFRGLWSAVLNQVYIGTSAYLKPWSFFLKRVCKQISGDDQWYREKAVIRPREEAGDDLNAVHIIRECLVDKEWGLGFDAVDDIDDDAWKEAANILYDEGFGLSMLWDQVVPVEDFINEILGYIAGILYQDLRTGRWILTLTRDADYSTAYDGYTTGDNNQGQINFPGDRYFAQTFTTTRSYTVDSCKVKIAEQFFSQTIDVQCEIQSVNSDGMPSGAVITQGTILNADISDVASWLSCTFDEKVSLRLNTQYALVVRPIAGIGTLYWRVNTFGQYRGEYYWVSNDAGSNWSRVIGNDFMFEIFAGGDLETFNEDDIIDLDEFTRPSYGEIIDQVTVQFWDKLAHKSRSCEARDIALMEKQGGKVIEKILNYQGICDRSLANNVAERELKLVTSMLAGMRLRCTRKMSHLKPNDTFKISWTDLGIAEMVIRALTVNYGRLDKNEIYLTCVEDAFSTAETIYGDAPDTLWTDPINDPVDITNRRVIEIPYWSLCNHVIGSLSLVAALDNATGFICTIAGKPTDDAFDYDILARLSASYDFEDIGEGNNAFTPTGVLTNILLRNAEDITIDLSSESDLDLVEDNTYAIINDEIVKVLSVDTTNNQVTIARGILDTVPAVHVTNDVIYFMGLNYGEIDIEYTNGNAPAVKLLPRTPNGSLAESDATIETKSPALASRMIRPYPPGNLKFNSESFPSYFSSGANGNKITISWNHRDRTSQVQLNSLVEHSDSGISLESGATYTIKLYDANNVLRQTISGLSGTSYELTEANEITWCGSLQEQLRFVIYAVRDGYNSWNDGYDITLERTLRGSVAASSGLTGWVVTDMDGRKTIVANSSTASNLDSQNGFCEAAVIETSGVAGILGSIEVEMKLSGNIAGIAGTAGELTII